MGTGKRRISSAGLFGLLLIVLGVVWVLKNTHVLQFEIKQWWPLILIAIGLIHLVNQWRFFDFSGWLFIIVGGIFLLTENDILDSHKVWKYWPVLLVLIGLHIIFKGVSVKKRIFYECCWDKHGRWGKAPSSDGYDGDLIDESCLFGGWDRHVTSKAFKGGNISVVFGGIDMDLLEAELAEEGGVLEISAVFGGVEIKIPTSWVIEDHSTAVFGGVDYKCSNPRGNTGKRLIIKASAVFSGIDIKN